MRKLMGIFLVMSVICLSACEYKYKYEYDADDHLNYFIIGEIM